MRKIIVGLILLSFCFAGNTNIRRGDLDKSASSIYTGREFITMIVSDQLAPTSSALVFYLDNIMGYALIGINSFEASAGSVPTTVSAQAVTPEGVALTVSAQIITAEIDLTQFWSPWYKITIPAATVTRNIGFVINIVD